MSESDARSVIHKSRRPPVAEVSQSTITHVVTTINHRYELKDGPMIAFIIMAGLYFCTTRVYGTGPLKISSERDDDSQAKE